MKRNYIAKRFQSLQTGFTLNTAALEKYSDIIDLSIGDPDLTTDERIIHAAFADAKAGYTHYGNPKGDPELIAGICKTWKEDFDQIVTPEEVIITASSCMGMYLALSALLDPGDEVITFSPYFAVYRQQIEFCGGKCVEVPTYAAENFSIDEQRLRQAVTEKTKAIIFNNPNNPTGMAYDRKESEIIAKIAQEYDLLVLADEIYTAYIVTGDHVPMRTLPGMEERTVTLNSFSKNYLMTGWRVGCIIADPAIIQVINHVNGCMIYAAPSVSQRAALAALPLRQEIRKEYVEYLLKRLTYVTSRIERIPYLDLVKPRGTFYLFPGIQKTGLTSAEFCRTLLEQVHVLVTPGHVFGSTGEGHFRIACTVDTDKLEEAFDRMEKLKF